MNLPEKNLVTELILLAIKEDLGEIGDITSNYFIDPKYKAVAHVISKSSAEIIFSGENVIRLIAEIIDPNLIVKFEKQEGSLVKDRERICTLNGSFQSILRAERIILNFTQRMSGIATLTKKYVDQVAETGAKILDTRKTTPGFRILAKQAVRAGGGTNHRMGLYDAVMIKDNHLVGLAGEDLNSLQERINKIKQDYPNIFIELEVDTIEQFKNYLKLKSINRILLDNMSIDNLKEAVRINNHQLELEASGGVNLDTVREIAKTGVDFISVGALTHSAVAVDLSLEIEHCK